MFHWKSRSYQLSLVVLLGGTLAALMWALIAFVPCNDDTSKTAQFLEEIKDKPTLLRVFMQQMPKGGDLHNHLGGSVYPETYLDWAAADGLCVDLSIPAILKLKLDEVCAGESRMLASDAMKVPEDEKRRRLIDGLSMRSFVPTPGWSGHDQFFATFDRTKEEDDRFGDMLVEVTRRASRQNLGYLELMVTNNVGEMMDFLKSVKDADPKLNKVRWAEWANWNDVTRTENINALHDALERGVGGKTLADQVQPYLDAIMAADAKRFRDLHCIEDQNSPSGYKNPDSSPSSIFGEPVGCEVVLRFLYQNIRKFSPDVVFTQFMFSWAVTRDKEVKPLNGKDKGKNKVPNPVVGMNLVTPEDWLVATRDYRLHMEMLDFLWDETKETDDSQPNIALHAGELTLGNVRPDELKYRIKLAIEKGHAKRIGHGVAIAYETDSLITLARMAGKIDGKEPILIEINLTSNAKILNVSGRDHPMRLYHAMDVPIALSTDDEGVLRSDLTRDYVLAVLDQGFGYADLKKFSANSLHYSFLDSGTKGKLTTRLDNRFLRFEVWVEDIADKICRSNWWNLSTNVSC